MSQEIYLALISILGSLLAGFIYAIRKWADVKERDHIHEQEMQTKVFEREIKLDDIRMDREDARGARDAQTVEYIAVNTETMRSVQKSIEQQTGAMEQVRDCIEREIGNGLTSLMRQQLESTATLLSMTRDICTTVQRVEEKIDNSDAPPPS